MNLYINFYQDKHIDRQKELEYCLRANLDVPELKRIYLFVEEKDLQYTKEIIKNSNKVTLLKVSSRPLYNDYFNYSKNNPDDINIVSNTDIIMSSKSLKTLKKWNWKDYCLALSRWDLREDLIEKNAIHYNHADSQDTWMVKGSFPNIPEANFTLGKKGCDNRIAFLLNINYTVINASRQIKTYHYHNSQIRNYAPQGINKDVVKPPYKIIKSTGLK